jgi:hypothetical protein
MFTAILRASSRVSNLAAPLRLANEKGPDTEADAGSCAIETARLAKRQASWLDDIHLNQKYPFLWRVVPAQACVL